MNTVKEEIISKINHYLQWQNIEDFDKIMNYIEFQIYLPPIKKYKVRVSKEISYNQDKASQIKQIALELNHGKSIWHRLSKRTISSYINLPKTLQQRNTSGESCYGKDIMYNLFYIHHLRLGDKLSNTKIKLFDQDVHFLDQKSDELLYVLFDFIESLASEQSIFASIKFIFSKLSSIKFFSSYLLVLFFFSLVIRD